MPVQKEPEPTSAGIRSEPSKRKVVAPRRISFIFRSVGLAYQEVGIALMGDHGEGFLPLRRFAGSLGTAVAVGLGLIAWTPLGRLWFEAVAGLAPELADFAMIPTRFRLGLYPWAW